jgi:hypothetical protein
MATAKTKSFKVDFYATGSDGDRTSPDFAELLARAVDGRTEALALDSEEDRYQVRSIIPSAKGAVVLGVFGRCRFGEQPVQGTMDGQESDVELAPGHGLIQKNHFMFVSALNLLVYQRNVDGSHISRFQSYVRHATGRPVELEPLLTRDSYRKLLEGGEAKWVDFSFSKPKDPSMYEGMATKKAVELVNEMGGLNARIRVSVGRSDQTLVNQLKDAIVMMARSGQAKVARVKLEELEAPVDLIAERIVETATVPVQENGRPSSRDIYAALQEARTQRGDDIRTFFGT